MRTPETSGDGSLHYHSSREERRGGREPAPAPKGLFKRNRSLAITLLDIAVLLLVFALYWFFLAPQAGIHRIDGVEFSASAFSFDEEIYITVAVERFREPREVYQPGALVRVTFPDGTESLDVVPEEVGEVFTHRTVITGDAARSILADESLQIAVSALGEEFSVSPGIEDR